MGSVANQMAKFNGGVFVEVLDDTEEGEMDSRQIFCVNKVEEAASDQLAWFVAEHTTRGAALRKNHTGAIDDGDYIGRAVEYRLQSSFA